MVWPSIHKSISKFNVLSSRLDVTLTKELFKNIEELFPSALINAPGLSVIERKDPLISKTNQVTNLILYRNQESRVEIDDV